MFIIDIFAGLTETGVLNFNTPLSNKFGSAGKVFYNTEMKVIKLFPGNNL